jgi:hypothetical protein
LINRTHSIGRTRPYSLPDVLNAVARTIRTPHVLLPEPHRIDWPHRIRGLGAVDAIEGVDTAIDEVDPATWPAALLGLTEGRVAGVAAWARALDVHRVTVFADTHQTAITVIGRTTAGPVIAVYDTVADWPLESAVGERNITAEELAAVAAAVADVASTADALAGV